MNNVRKAMTDEERTEYDQVLKKAVATEGSTRDQASTLIALLTDAEQAGRRWATRILDDFRHDGAAKEVRAYLKRKRESLLAASIRSMTDPELRAKLDELLQEISA